MKVDCILVNYIHDCGSLFLLILYMYIILMICLFSSTALLTNDKGPLFDLYGRSSMELVLTAQDHFFFESHLVEIMTGFISDVKSRVEYIASIDTTTYDRYIVWIESSECDVGSSTLAEFIDGKLQDIDSAYRDRRNEDALKALVVIKLKEGTFSKITEFMKSKTLGAEVQLKIPRVVINQEVEKTLKENVLVY